MTDADLEEMDRRAALRVVDGVPNETGYGDAYRDLRQLIAEVRRLTECLRIQTNFLREFTEQLGR